MVYYIQTNLFSSIILALVYLNLFNKQEQKNTETRIFKLIIIFNFIILVLDTFMWIFDGRRGLLIRILYLIDTMAYYTLMPIFCVLWSIYADYHIFGSIRRLKKIIKIFIVPLTVNFVLSVMSIFGDFLFYIDDSNVYHRGKLYFLSFFMIYFFFLNTILLIHFNRKRIPKKLYKYLMVYSILPIIGGVIQTLYYGLVLVFSSSAISVLIAYIFIQKNQLKTDYLTGLYNRRQFDNYLSDLSEKKRNFAGVMIDIDNFKHINDKLGHIIGDNALERTAKILRDTFGAGDFLSRYGGDEFVVITEISDMDKLKERVDVLRKNVLEFNLSGQQPYKLNLSIGYDLYDAGTMSIQEFILHIDRLMYKDKHYNKNQPS